MLIEGKEFQHVASEHHSLEQPSPTLSILSVSVEVCHNNGGIHIKNTKKDDD
jgi:hypothetical protein